MKKVFLFRTLLLFIEVLFIVLTCKYGFYRETKVSFPDRKVEVAEYSDGEKYLKVYNKAGNSSVSINVTEEQLKSFESNNYFIGYWYKMHLILHLFFWIFVSILFIYYIWSVISLWGCLHEEDGKFTAYSSCDLCKVRCALYNNIANYDLTPAKKKWYNFWGYY